MSERYQQFRRERERRRPRWPLVLSLLVNVLLIALFARYVSPWLASLGERPDTPTDELQWVDLQPLPEPSERGKGQIIENERANEIEPEEADYVAEKASSVERQSVGPRGLPAPGEAGQPRAGSQAGEDTEASDGVETDEPGSEEQPSDGRVTDVRELFPSGEQIAKVLAEQRKKAAAARGGDGGQDLPVSVGESLDAIDPSVPQGQFTLLNAKSFKYAGFIRRVGRRVFDQLLGQIYSHSFSLGLRPGAEGYAVVETVMNMQGEQLSTRIYRMGGEPAYAEAARVAMVRGAWDLNPPEGAEAEDGLIHWVLVADLRYLNTHPRGGPQYKGRASFGIL